MVLKYFGRFLWMKKSRLIGWIKNGINNASKKKRKKEENSAFGGVFDKFTIETLNKLRVKGVFDEMIGIVSAGKEANVYYAVDAEDRPLAVKIYKIDPQNTKWMKNYILGDPRFKKIGNKTHNIIYTWCKKEYKNLKQMHRHGLPVPEPVMSLNNVLVMEFIGFEEGIAAPRLRDAPEIKDPLASLQRIITYIRKMYLEAHLVHGDLSEYNILYHNFEEIIIDVSQAVSVFHINAPVFLKRDFINVLNFYGHFVDPKDLPTPDSLVQEILANL